MSERDENNRKLAEWAGWKITATMSDKHQFFIWHCPECKCIAASDKVCVCVELCGEHPPDFYSSEEANAMLLEKMPAAELYKHPPDHLDSEAGWRCRPDWGLDAAAYHVDRKTAICAATLAMLEAEGKR